MCGRFSLYSPSNHFAQYFDARVEPEVTASYAPSYNVAPSEQVLAIRLRDGVRSIGRYRWGLVPFFARSPASARRAFNARAEEVASKPYFRSAFAARRVIVPADSFFEWSKRKLDAKTPYCISRRDGAPLAFAGLRERWHHQEGLVIESVAIITTRAGEDLMGVHDRMPVVLEPDSFETWLETSDLDEARSLLVPSPASTLEMYPVDRRVGSVEQNDAELVAPAPVITTPTLPF